MNRLIGITLALLFGTTACPAERAVPFESISFAIDVGDSWKRMRIKRDGQLAEVINQAKESEKWYEANKELFVTPTDP